MIISKKNLLCFLVMFMAIAFRYLSMWDLISSTQRYIILPIIIVFFILYLFNKKVKREKVLLVILIALFGILDFIISNEIDILMSLLIAFIYLFDNGDKLLLKHFLISSIFFYILTIVLSKLHIITNLEFVRVVNNVTIIRNGLGFSNPNHAFTLLISIIISFYLLLNIKNKKILFSILVLFASYSIYTETNCRTGFYSILIFIILIFADKYVEKILTNKMKYLFLIMTIISISIGLVYGNSQYMNELLTNRPIIWHNHITQFPISLLGNETAKVDNNYLWLIYRHGIIIYIFYFLINWKATKYFIKNKKLFISLLIILVYSLFENMLNYAFNAIFILSLLYFINNFEFKMCYLDSTSEVIK